MTVNNKFEHMADFTATYNNLRPCLSNEVDVCIDNCGRKYYLPKYENPSDARYGFPLQGFLSPNEMTAALDGYSVDIGIRTYFTFKLEWPIDVGNSYIIGNASDISIGNYLEGDVVLHNTVIYFDCPGVYTVTATYNFEPTDAASRCNVSYMELGSCDGFLDNASTTSVPTASFYANNPETVSLLCDVTQTIQKTFVHGSVTDNTTGKLLNKGYLILGASTALGWNIRLLNFSLTRAPGPLVATPAVYFSPDPTSVPAARAERKFPVREHLKAIADDIRAKRS